MTPPFDDFNGAASRHAGSGVNAPLDKEGRTALHIAVEKQDKEGLARLLRVGANPDQKNRIGQSAIYEAITRRKPDMIDLLAEKGASLNITDDNNRTPLDWAIEQGCDADVVAKLKFLGAQTDPAPSTLRTPLHLAAEKNRADLVQFFVAAGIDINAQDREGRTPLFCAIESKALGAVQKLLALGADPLRRDTDIRTPLHAAAASGYREGAEALLQRDEVRRTINDFQTYSTGFTPLMAAVAANHPEVAEKIIAAGANVNAKDHQSRHSLFIAAENGSLECARLLIAAGADVGKNGGTGYGQQHMVHSIGIKAYRPMLALLYAAGIDLNVKNNNGQTALNMACEAIDKEKVRALLELGADPNIANAYGRRPLDAVMDHYGFTYNYGGEHNEIIGLLLKAGASPDLSPAVEMKSAPLHLAARAGNLPVMKMLLQYHPGIDQPDRTDAGLTPLMAAVEGGRGDVAQFLQDNGADPSRADNFGRTLIHFAARGGDEKLIASLLALPGADIGKKDGRGRTPLHHACRKDKKAAAVALLKAGADPAAFDAQGYAPLHLAVEVNYNPDVLLAFKDFFGDKADWNIAAKDGNTPLHVAARCNQTYAMQKLLELGADPAKPGKDGLLPLDLSILNGSEWSMAPLLEAMKKRNIPLSQNRDANGSTTLHHGARRDHGIVLRLIGAGAEVNAANNAGDTPLHIAARAGKDDIVRLLLLNGADPAAANLAGETPGAAAAAARHDFSARIIAEEVARRAQAAEKPAASSRVKPPQP